MFFWLSVIFIYSIFRTGKITYPITYQVFLEECKHAVKEKKVPKYIIDDKQISLSSDRENSDEEDFDEENSDKENFDEKKI